MQEAGKKIDDAIEYLRKSYAGISAGRAKTGLLSSIKVEAYGGASPLEQLASITADGHNTLRVICFDRGIVGAVFKAIISSNMGLNPQRAGDTLLVNVPSLDDDQRIKLDKRVKFLAEEQRIVIRGVRKNVRNLAKRNELLDKIKKPLDKLIEEKIGIVDQMMKSKLDAIHWKDPRWNK